MGGIADKRRGLSAAEVLSLISSDGLALTSATPAGVGAAGVVGTGTTAARSDHVHAHGVFTADYHTNYQQESEKGQAEGYASLDISSQVPAGQAPAKAVYSTGGGQALSPGDIEASNQWSGEEFGSVQTTDATPLVCGQAPIAADKVSLVTAWVTGRRTTGAEAAGFLLRGVYRRTGATVTIIGTVDVKLSRKDVGGWNATLVINGTNVDVQVTGAAASSIDWKSRIELLQAP